MARLWGWLKKLLLFAVGLLLFYFIFQLVFMDFMVDVWWFDSLGYLNYFFWRLTYRFFILGIFSLVFFLIFFLNFWVASRFLGALAPEADQPDLAQSRYRVLRRKFSAGSFKLYTPFSLILAVILAWPFYQRWEETLLFLFAPPAGVTDPFFGIDVSFFLFSLPIYLSIFNTLIITLALLFLGLVLLYWLERRYLATQERPLPRGAMIHLTIMVLSLFIVGIWGFFLQRYSLLYTTSHEAIFYGPGYVERWVVLPLIWVTIFFLLTTAVSLVYYLNARKGMKVLLVSTVFFFLALGARYSPFLPNLVQKYVVKPNEMSKEQPFIENNIKATLEAFRLDNVERREYDIKPVETDLQEPKIKYTLRNIPVWDRDVLLEVYQQLQELRTYYKFSPVNVDRYTVGGVYQQVFLSPREISLADLPKASQNWINERLQFTHGIGVVMTPAAQGGGEPMTWFIQDVPPQSDYGFKIANPAIYFGRLKLGYVIAPNASHEIGYPTPEGNKLTDYTGKDGIPVHSLFRRLLFSMYFKDRDILFTFKTIPKSKILFRRNITDRITTLTPFLLLDSDPYVVVTEKGLYWIQDAYTTSKHYPYAQPYEKPAEKTVDKPAEKFEEKSAKQRLNYIRNSVKIVVDAYNGTVDYYLADELTGKPDPIIRGYNRMYPGLLKSIDQMPPDLKDHIRYPKDIFDIQVEIFAKYHQYEPNTFYRQEDLWEFPEVMQNGKPVRMRPYYLTVNILQDDKFEFLSVCPMIPRARTNLRSLMVAGSDPENYGKIFAFDFPKGLMVFGPSQIDAFIDQDTTISQQFTLWNQAGSQVERGKMILLPIPGAVVYIQPVYLKAAAGVAIPQLQRIILNKGEVTVMEPSLEEGLVNLDKRMQELSERAKRRLEEGKPAEAEPETPGPSESPQQPPAETAPEGSF
jgi:hypothetical protein